MKNKVFDLAIDLVLFELINIYEKENKLDNEYSKMLFSLDLFKKYVEKYKHIFDKYVCITDEEMIIFLDNFKYLKKKENKYLFVFPDFIDSDLYKARGIAYILFEKIDLEKDDKLDIVNAEKHLIYNN